MKFLYMQKGIQFLPQTKFSHSHIFAIHCRRPMIFPTMNSVGLNNKYLKYQRFTMRLQI